jgi:hypothetical protein
MALLVLDSRRLQQSRLDCLPCIRVPYRDASGAWVYDDVSENEDDDHQGSAAAGSHRPWGLPGIRALRGLAGDGQQQGSAADPGEMYFAPQQQLPPAAAAAAGHDAFDGERLTPSPLPTVLPGVTKSGPGLLHGDKVSLQSLLQVRGGSMHMPALCVCNSESSASALAVLRKGIGTSICVWIYRCVGTGRVDGWLVDRWLNGCLACCASWGYIVWSGAAAWR